MKILIAPDSFKGSLSAFEVASVVADALGFVAPNAEIISLPLADGGEGTARLLTRVLNGTWCNTVSSDPLFRPIRSGYGISVDRETAYLDMAESSGLTLLAEAERNCMHTSTIGTGELMLDALKKGVKNIILGIGGSSTNDGGIGMAHAFGYRFVDKHENELKPVGSELIKVEQIRRPINLPHFVLTVLCDVSNPLYGLQGAAYTYARQKGASESEMKALDKGLRNLAEILWSQWGMDITSLEGGGAAGGLGAGSVAFLGGSLTPGIDWILDTVDFSNHLEDSDLVITGEGKIDDQSKQGKLLSGVCREAMKKGKPVVAFGGIVDNESDWPELAYAYSITPDGQNIEEAILNASENLYNAVVRHWPEITGTLLNAEL